MKAIFFISILASNLLFTSQAQVRRIANFKISTYDLSSNKFFDLNSHIDHITIVYFQSEAKIVNIYHRNKSSTTVSEQYTLTFDGDLHLLSKKYNQFPIPDPSVAKLTYNQGITKVADSHIVCELRTTLRRDSIKHDFSFSTVAGTVIPRFFPTQYRPTFRGDLVKLTKKLEQNFKQWEPITHTDSLIIVSGTVEKNGTIGPLKLTEGRSSNYTKNILDFMSKEATSWIPKFNGGGARPSPVRISVRVNKDGSLKISML